MKPAKEHTTAWFREWFGDEYLALYPHRDRAEAREAVELLHQAAGPVPGDRVLDLGCGAGRHLGELCRLGYRATGLDLSMPMLDAARSAAEAPVLVRGDMRRLPFRTSGFDIVTSYFTSFGYFDDEDDDARVLYEVRRVLRPGGRFLLDFLNANQVVTNLRERDRRRVGDVEVVQERRLVQGGRIVEKRIAIGARDGAPHREFVERVRLYMPDELTRMLESAGLSAGARFGGYDRRPFSRFSPRFIVLAEAAA